MGIGHLKLRLRHVVNYQLLQSGVKRFGLWTEIEPTPTGRQTTAQGSALGLVGLAMIGSRNKASRCVLDGGEELIPFPAGLLKIGGLEGVADSASVL